MNPETTTRGGALAQALILLLVVLTGLEFGAALVIVLGAAEATAIRDLNTPTSFFALTLAVIAVSLLRTRGWVRLVVATTASLVVLCRVVLAVLAVAPARNTMVRIAGTDLVTICAGVATGIALCLWLLVEAPREVREESVASMSAHAAPAPLSSGGQWQTVNTPWPRANEADPEGTLIRPPRR